MLSLLLVSEVLVLQPQCLLLLLMQKLSLLPLVHLLRLLQRLVLLGLVLQGLMLLSLSTRMSLAGLGLDWGGRSHEHKPTNDRNICQGCHFSKHGSVLSEVEDVSGIVGDSLFSTAVHNGPQSVT
jgi:hypothetical protein